MAILFICACCIEIRNLNVVHVNSHFSPRSWISREERSRWSGHWVWLPALSRGPEKGERGSCFSFPTLTRRSYSPDHWPGNDRKWIPRCLRIISLPEVFATKTASAEVAGTTGTWKKKIIGDHFLSSMKKKPSSFPSPEVGSLGKGWACDCVLGKALLYSVYLLEEKGKGAHSGERVLASWDKKSSETPEETG